MKNRATVKVVIPALNEEKSLPLVLAEIPRAWVDEVIVVDNGSEDRTAAVAERLGATVVREPRRGYGSACLAGLRYLEASPAELVVFLDADYSDSPGELPSLVQPILDGAADFVLGSRTLGLAEKGAVAPQARWGNALATTLMRWLYGHRYTDMGPFRAIRADRLAQLEMRDRNYGWNMEMQVKAIEHGLRILEVPVRYKRRIGVSKISGTVRGTLAAGYKILYTLFRLRFLGTRSQRALRG
jgi:glycosyltransferase involved in cell wall biosynthesis